MSDEYLKAVRAAKIEKEIIAQQLKIDKEKGKLVEIKEVIPLVTAPVVTLTHRIKSTYKELAGKVNPEDPQLADEILQVWVEEILEEAQKALQAYADMVV